MPKVKKTLSGASMSSKVPGALPTIKLAAADLQELSTKASEDVARKMGIRPNALPEGVKEAIRTATEGAVDARLKAVVQQSADQLVKTQVTAGVMPAQMISARLKAAREGLQLVAGDVSLDSVLQDASKLLYKKYQALQAAGFSPEQAWSLLLAEVSGRAGRAR